ncbi:hypothetical protein BS50DRAFT_272048 [Corynespora cassiicola Philippines]|uniref:Uncharacterized protein n=1 Tax=Corynespora cassiicola Philippines TaxID=1448308 RepID=A0A2T2P0J5_CORCC|nr:hypothetical protein BS50DRAFT_272048 [Corynespora cassiicola Philippines]
MSAGQGAPDWLETSQDARRSAPLSDMQPNRVRADSASPISTSASRQWDRYIDWAISLFSSMYLLTCGSEGLEGYCAAVSRMICGCNHLAVGRNTNYQRCVSRLSCKVMFRHPACRSSSCCLRGQGKTPRKELHPFSYLSCILFSHPSHTCSLLSMSINVRIPCMEIVLTPDLGCPRD